MQFTRVDQEFSSPRPDQRGPFDTSLFFAKRSMGDNLRCKAFEGNINWDRYVSILHKGFLPLFSGGEMIKGGSLFIGDGAPCHMVNTTHGLLDESGIKKASMLKHLSRYEN